MEDLLAGDVTANPELAAATAARTAITSCLSDRAAGFRVARPAELWARGFSPPYAQPTSNAKCDFALCL